MSPKAMFAVLVTVVALATVVKKPLRLGLDLRGGTSLFLQVANEGGGPLKPGVLEQTRRIVERKVNAYGISEAAVQPYGSAGDRLLVQIPSSTADLSRVRESLRHQGVMEWFAVAEGPFPGQSEAYRARGGALHLGEKLFATRAESKNAAWYITQGAPVIRGADLRDAKAVPGENGAWATGFTLSNEAGARFASFTEQNRGRQLAMVLDGEVLSAGVIEERIQNEGQIRGAHSAAEAEDLAILLRAGAVPAAVKLLEESEVAPTLGADSVRQGITAGVLGLGAIVFALLVIYRRRGINAAITLALNGVILLALLLWFDAVLTLPGIAGLILTAGMAVDSNVLIFERIRELRPGRSESAATHAGFDRAWATILDTHVTTIVSCAFLYWFGTVAVRGFSVTLALGLITNLFTAVFVSRLLFEWDLARRG